MSLRLKPADRREFIGGSDARIVMGDDEAALALLAIVAAGLEPSGGSVVYSPFGEFRQAVRAELGWLAHESRAYRDLTARENVELAARLNGIDPATGFSRVAETLGLPLGVTKVTCATADRSFNVATGHFNVTVVDRTAPTSPATCSRRPARRGPARAAIAPAHVRRTPPAASRFWGRVAEGTPGADAAHFMISALAHLALSNRYP
jgi:hypothetical protein